MGVAEERGLNREGLKEAAREVGETFTAAMSEGTSSSYAACKSLIGSTLTTRRDRRAALAKPKFPRRGSRPITQRATGNGADTSRA